MSEIEAKVNQFKELFYQDKFYDCFDLLEELESIPQAAEILQDCEEIQRLKQDIESEQLCQQLINDNQDWILHTDNNGIRVSYKGTGTDFYVKAEQIVNVNNLKTIALFAEPDLMQTWVPSMSYSGEVGAPSMYRRIVRYKVDLPWPLARRDFVSYVVGLSIPDSSCTMLMERAVQGDRYLGIQTPEVDEGDVRGEMNIACLLLQKIGENCTRITYISRNDPKLDMLPQSLINYCAKQIMEDSMIEFQKVAYNFDASPYNQRLQENTSFYNRIREDISQFN